MLKILLISIGVCCLTILSAQNIPITAPLIFNNHHLVFRAGYINNQVNQLTQIDEKGSFEALSCNGGFFGVGWIANPYTNLGLEIGLNFSVQNVGYTLNLESSEFQIPNSIQSKDGIPELYLEIPILIHPRILLSDKDWLEGHFGLTMNFYMPSSVEYDINEGMDIKAEDLTDIQVVFPGENPYWSAMLGIGWQRLTKEQNLIGIHLMSTIGFKNVLNGNYLLWDNQSVVGAGSFTSKGSYIGLSVSYAFTGIRGVVQKMKQLDLANF